MEIKILGTAYPTCRNLHKIAEKLKENK